MGANVPAVQSASKAEPTAETPGATGPAASAPGLRSLHRKLAQIMWDAERIPKRGKAPAVMGGYPFVQVGDAADFVRKALAEHVLSMLPTSVRVVGQVDRETAKGGNMTTVDLITTWTITDGESGESVTFESFGAGADGGDKYSGKASTSAMKYALLTAFLLSTGDDTEAHVIPEQRAPTPRPTTHEATTDGGLIGVAQLGDAPADYQLREEPDGWALSFKLMDGRKGFRVVARDDLALALAVVREAVIGQRVTCFGRMGTDSFVKDGRSITYNVFDLERIQSAEFTLPAEGASGGPPKVEAAGPSDGPSGPAALDESEIDRLPMFAEGEAA